VSAVQDGHARLYSLRLDAIHSMAQRLLAEETLPQTAESLDVLSTILGGGATSRLYRALVVEQRLAVAAGAYYDGGARSDAEFGVYAYPRPGVGFDQLEAAMDAVIAAMMAALPEEGELERARTRLMAGHIYEQDNQFALAMDYGSSLAIGLTVADVEDWPNRIRAVTAQAVQDAARDYLIRREAVTGRLSPAAP